MSYQPQDERVDRATSRWWRTPVVAACLRVLAMLGFAGLAWAAASSVAHADAGSSTTESPALSTAASAAAPATSILGPVAGPVARPLATAVSPVAPDSTVAVTPILGDTSGALAPATTPASGRSVVTGAAEFVAAPAQGLLPVGSGQDRTAPGLLGTAALTDPLSVTQGIAASLGVDAVTPLATVVRPLTDAARPLTDRFSPVRLGLPKVKAPAVRLPIGGSFPWTGDEPVPATAERSISPAQAALPAVPATDAADPARLAGIQSASPDATSGTTVGAAQSAPTRPAPGPGSVPAIPGGALHSGSTTGSSAHQHDGPTGAVASTGLAARMLASRVFAVTEDSGVTLVHTEDPSVSPD